MVTARAGAFAAFLLMATGAAADEAVTWPDASANGRRYSAVGVASYYGAEFAGRQTADGERFDANGLTAAHKTLPLPCYARVTNLRNNRSLIVRVNDRGPFVRGRLIDLSARAATLLEFRNTGTTKVRIDYVGPALAAGSDSARLLASLKSGDAPAAIVARSQPPVADGVTRVARSSEILRTGEGRAVAAAPSPYGALETYVFAGDEPALRTDTTVALSYGPAAADGLR